VNPVARAWARGGSGLLLLLLGSAPVLAAESSVPAIGGGLDPLGPAYLLKVLLSLLFVLGLMFLLAALMKRMQRLGGPALHGMRVISSVAVGPRERVVLLEVGDRQVLVGVAPGRIVPLDTLAQPVNWPAPEERVASATGFGPLLERLRKPGGRTDGAGSKEAGP
jgi:flagellar protein FliO/FliZ